MQFNKNREISKERIKSLEKLSNNLALKQNNVLDYIQYMQDPVTGFYDLNKAEDLRDLAFVERITKDPKRSGECEKYQIEQLKKAFKGFLKAEKGSLFLNKGGYVSSLQLEYSPDLDGTITDIDGNIFGFTLKYSDQDGTMQTHQFDELFNMIDFAPKICSELPPLSIFVSGDFWTKLRKKYQYIKYENKISLIDILSARAQEIEAKVIVFTDCDLPVNLTEYYLFIKKFESLWNLNAK